MTTGRINQVTIVRYRPKGTEQAPERAECYQEEAAKAATFARMDRRMRRPRAEDSIAPTEFFKEPSGADVGSKAAQNRTLGASDGAAPEAVSRQLAATRPERPRKLVGYLT